MKKLTGLILLALMPYLGNATHALGGEITWSCSTNGDFIFTLKIYRDCGTNNSTNCYNSQTTTISGPNGNIVLTKLPGYPKDISPQCYAGNGIGCDQVASGEGAIEEHVYQSNPIPLTGTPPAGGWFFTWSCCCRPGTIQNGPSGNYLLRAVMYPFTPQGSTTPLTVNNCYDSSPFFAESAALVICEGSPFVYNHLAGDRDLDSLYFKWASPWTGINNPVTWDPGYSVTSPFPNPNTDASNGPVILDGASGQVSMDVQVADAGSYASCFGIESWRCGQVGNKPGWIKIAEVYRDVAIVFKKNCPANAEPLALIDTTIYTSLTRNGNLYTTQVYPGDTVLFELNASDFDFLPNGSPQEITFTAAGLQVANPMSGTTGCLGAAPCASLNPIAPQNSYVQTLNNNIEFFWVPNCAHLNFGNTGCGGTNKFFFSMRMQDNACPAPEISLSTIVVEVIPGDPTAPDIKCLSYLPGGTDYQVSWDEAEQDSSLDFNYYVVWGSNNRTGPYTQADTIYDIDSLYTYIDTALGYKHYYMQKSTGLCDFLSNASDTLDLMEINLTALPPVSSQYASLTWTPLSTPLAPSTRGVYEIWAEAPAGSGNWVQVGETTGLTFVDTVQVCNSMVNYQIRVTDTVNGCQSGSTIDSSQFSDQTNSDIINMDSITVGPNGYATMSWPSSNYGDVDQYYILFNDPGLGWVIVDTIPVGTAMPYEFNESQASSRSEEYKIVSVDSCGNQSDEQLVSSYQTIYLRNFTNKCEGYTRLSWTPYKRFTGGVAGYRLWVKITDANGSSSPWSLLYGGTSDDSTFTQTSLLNGHQYCYRVQAYDTSGAFTSTSNEVCMDSDVPKKSRLIYLAQITNNFTRGSIDLTAYVDGEADVKDYVVERALDRLGPYEEIGRVAQPNSLPYQIRFTDYGVRPDDHHYYYRLSATNICGGRDTLSNTSQNVLLEVFPQSNLKNRLVWNQYRDFGGNVESYEIYRSSGKFFGNFEYLGETKGNDSTFVDDISSLAAEEGDFCYYIKAVEGNNPIGFIDSDGSPYSSLSNRACGSQKPGVFVPTAFTPNSGVLANRKFGPVMRFEDISSYDFYILNRWGKMVFQTSDPKEHWDGTFEDGEAPQGAYVYYVKYTGTGDVDQELKGSFTLIR